MGFPRLTFRTQQSDASSLAEQLATVYNDEAKGLPFFAVIDIAALESSIEPEVLDAVGERVAYAEARVLRDMGEWDTAWTLLKPYALATAEKLRSRGAMPRG